jgi:hypothetical protein
MISSQQLTDYEANGFLVIEDFASGQECDELRSRAEQMVREFELHHARTEPRGR